MSEQNDPIRAWLTAMIREGDSDPDYYGASEMCAALRAVLDLLGEPVRCAHYEDPLAVREDEIRTAIAAALGVER